MTTIHNYKNAHPMTHPLFAGDIVRAESGALFTVKEYGTLQKQIVCNASGVRVGDPVDSQSALCAIVYTELKRY